MSWKTICRAYSPTFLIRRADTVRGDRFLRLFLDEIRLSLDETLRSGFPSSDFHKFKVHPEYPTDKGRRIDIVLEMPDDNHWIGIEKQAMAAETWGTGRSSQGLLGILAETGGARRTRNSVDIIFERRTAADRRQDRTTMKRNVTA